MNSPATHPAFEWLRSTKVPALKVELHEFRHRKTGALHLHISADDEQNAFLVAFRTVPQDSTGVAHILEHTALCGSRRYPVRDPFFMMTRRSLNTFMNAFTSSDWTAYPFASCNRKDFDNLLGVYLDAAFFPTLDPLDFAQEGHRLEFAKPDDASSELTFKGVVFNEMKGAMSSPVSTLFQTLTSYVFPTTTYHHNSGGEPVNIPDLSYDELVAFHARHYHPSNAVFMTYGDIPASDHQARFEELALAEFEANPEAAAIRVGCEERLTQPLAVEGSYALEGEEETADKTHIVLGWLLGENTDMEQVLTATLLSDVLLDNSASPLRRALETSDLGEAPSPLCGMMDSTREMLFACGVEGSNPEQAEAVEQLVLDTLQRVAEEGVEPEEVEAMLHQLELHQREVSGDGYPYGLSLMLHALTPAVHDADPAAALDIDPILTRLRERIGDPDYIPGLVRSLLLDNPHRVRLTLRPDPELAATRRAEERARLDAIRAGMDDAAAQQVVEQALALKARQEQEDDVELLPRVGLDDIPTDLDIPQGRVSELSGLPTTWYSRATNGLVYQSLVVDLPDLDPELADLLPLFTDVLTEVGSAGRDYLESQGLQAAVTGGISARVNLRGAVDDVQRTRALFTLSGKALLRNQAALTRLMHETFHAPRFDELERIRELVSQERLHMEQGVTSSGHTLAMAAAAAGFSPSAAIIHRWNGLLGLKLLKAMDDGLDEAGALERLADAFTQISAALKAAPRQLLLIGEAEAQAEIEAAVAAQWAGAGSPAAAFAATAEGVALRQAWSTSTQVNFCARAYPAVAASHPDAAALTILAPFLRNNFLHRAVREQGGAYGGGASFDLDSGVFRFYSYRDPRLAETLADFDAAIEWLEKGDHEPRLLEEAILGVIASIDKPGSPAGEARKAFFGALHGRDAEQRKAYRARLLAVTLGDLRRVAATYLKPAEGATVVISSPSTLDATGLELERIVL